MSMTVKDIARVMQAEVIRAGSQDVEITDLVTDSRKIFRPATSLFFAIHGRYQNGHDFIEDASKRGIECFVVSEETDAFHLPENCWVLKVKDSLTALQQLAAYHRSLFSIPVVGITGSNGKTVVKDWLAQMLSPDHNVVKSPGSYNSQVGVPLSVWLMDETDQVGIFEAGISQPGEMEKLQKIIRPTVGIFTNIGAPHAENFESADQKAAEKIRLFAAAGVVIYCADYPEVVAAVDRYLPPTVKKTGWSREHGHGVSVQYKMNETGTSVDITDATGRDVYQLPFTDKASLENAVHCILALKELGCTTAAIAQRTARLQQLSMRLEMKKGKNNCTIINDSYSSDTGSLRIALDALEQLNQHQQKTLILSDILQSGKSADELYREVSDLVLSHHIQRVIGVGKEIVKYAGYFPASSVFFEDTAAFMQSVKPVDFYDEDVLIKGARVYGFERIVQMLEEKTHQTVMEVNLNAMVHNLNYFRRRLNPETRLMVMVKAASYGTGHYEIANLLQYYHVDYLAVAYADEGVILRNAGITLPIMVMSPENHRYDVMAEYNLEPEIYSMESLQEFIRFSSGQKKVKGIHIKVDTGMHRLGFEPGDEEKIAAILPSHIPVLSVFSHLAAADNPLHDDFTRQQIAAYQLFHANLSSRIGYAPLRHILNSGGISRFPEAMMDMVRLGVGLYGVGVNAEEQKSLEQVVRLKTVVSQVKKIKPGESVGYNRSFIAGKEMQIATVPVGYADGLRRALSNGVGRMIIQGHPAPVTGRICMDMTMLDVTGLDVKPGDEVTVIGNGYTILDMAADLHTIPYEILTGIAERVKRVYVQE